MNEAGDVLLLLALRRRSFRFSRPWLSVRSLSSGEKKKVVG